MLPWFRCLLLLVPTRIGRLSWSYALVDDTAMHLMFGSSRKHVRGAQAILRTTSLSRQQTGPLLKWLWCIITWYAFSSIAVFRYMLNCDLWFAYRHMARDQNVTILSQYHWVLQLDTRFALCHVVLFVSLIMQVGDACTCQCWMNNVFIKEIMGMHLQGRLYHNILQIEQRNGDVEWGNVDTPSGWGVDKSGGSRLIGSTRMALSLNHMEKACIHFKVFCFWFLWLLCYSVATGRRHLLVIRCIPVWFQWSQYMRV